MLPYLGQVRFTRQTCELEDTGHLLGTVTHELGHVLGFGTIWEEAELLREPSLPDPANRGADTHFSGPLALAAFDRAGGSAYRGNKVPVENDHEYGSGTQDGHWRESVMDTELMTGLLDLGREPLSRITIESFADLGYEVDLSQADSYRVRDAQRRAAGAPEGLHLVDDIDRRPIRAVDAMAAWLASACRRRGWSWRHRTFGPSGLPEDAGGARLSGCGRGCDRLRAGPLGSTGGHIAAVCSRVGAFASRSHSRGPRGQLRPDARGRCSRLYVAPAVRRRAFDVAGRSAEAPGFGAASTPLQGSADLDMRRVGAHAAGDPASVADDAPAYLCWRPPSVAGAACYCGSGRRPTVRA